MPIVPGGKRVFATSATYSGDLLGGTGAVSGLAGGDALCTATGSVMGGEWKAWLSDSRTNAFDRIDDFSPWYNLMGMVAFPNKASLRSAPANPIFTEDLNTSFGVWTGTHSGGGKSTATCTDWTSSDRTVSGTRGFGPAATWTDFGQGDEGCSHSLGLICFEQ